MAFSLNAAHRTIGESMSKDAEAEHLGGITRLMTVVFDRANKDVILVGRAERNRPPLSLSDFVVGLRARLVRQEWPLVSIDPAPETRMTGKQHVRFEGGIERTGFGKAALDADIALKGLALGMLQMNGLRSFFAIRAATIKTKAAKSRSNQVWFCALEPLLEENDDVFAIRELPIGVRTRPAVADKDRKGSPEGKDDVAEEFAREITGAFETLAQAVPEIGKIRGLFEMAAVADGIGRFGEADLKYWLEDYHVPAAETPTQFDYVVRRETISTADGSGTLEIGGGIDFEVLAMRLVDGDLTALKEAVLLTRPGPNVLTWTVPVTAGDRVLKAASNRQSRSGGGDEHAGTVLEWRIIDGQPSPVFRVVDSKDFKIVEPPVPSDTPVITLPNDRSRGGVPDATASTKATDQTRALLAEIEKGMHARNSGLQGVPQSPEPQGMYHTGADGLQHLNGSSLPDAPSKGMYHTGADGLQHLNGSSLPDTPSKGMYRTGADGLQHLTDGPVASASHSGGTAICAWASCLGQPQETPDGLTAVPYAHGDLNPYSARRYFEAGWIVTDRNNNVVGKGWGDVKLLGDGKFAAKVWNGDGYRIYDATGKQVSESVFHDVASLNRFTSGGSSQSNVDRTNAIPSSTSGLTTPGLPSRPLPGATGPVGGVSTAIQVEDGFGTTKKR